ncbi:MAG: hypothetical protein AAB019_10945 [Planctomycetota bacterium]
MKTPQLYFLFISTLLFISSCASTPPESVLLSEDLTALIISSRDTHLAMIEEYFNEKKQQVEQFIEQEWTPDYLNDFIKTSGVLKDLSNTKSPDEKYRILNEFTGVAVKEINNRRISMLGLLGKVENKLAGKVKTHYSSMLEANQSLTAHLESSAEVTAPPLRRTSTREELMARLRILPEEIIPLNKIKSQLEPLMHYQGKIEELNQVLHNIDILIEGNGNDH